MIQALSGRLRAYARDFMWERPFRLNREVFSIQVSHLIDSLNLKTEMTEVIG